jgi:hypothetical protein
VLNPVPCSNPVTYTNVADGGHTFYIWVRDAAGNYGYGNYSWTIDATSPSIGTLNVSCDSTTGALDVSWSVTEAHSYSGSCQYPTGTNVGACTTGWSGSLRPSGSTFTVTLTDSFGNTSSKSKSISTLACN